MFYEKKTILQYLENCGLLGTFSAAYQKNEILDNQPSINEKLLKYVWLAILYIINEGSY